VSAESHSPPAGSTSPGPGPGEARPTGPGLSAAEVATWPLRRVPHLGRWVTIVVTLLVIASVVTTAVNNTNYGWSVVGQYLFASIIVHGILLTLWVTVACMVIGIVLGNVLAFMRRSSNYLLRASSWLYIWFFRGTPVLVQLIFWYNLAALYPRLSIGIPFGGPTLASGSTNKLITAYTAALLGFGLNEAAYQAEIVRSGIESVDPGQLEAARALGLRPAQTVRKVLLPQAIRTMIPPTGNEFISMLKTTSLASVIALSDVLYSAQKIYSTNFQTIPLLIVASIWYLLATSVLSVGQEFLERRFFPRNGPTRPPR